MKEEISIAWVEFVIGKEWVSSDLPGNQGIVTL